MNIIVSDSDDDFIPTVKPPPRQARPAPAKKKVLTKTRTRKEKKVLTSSQDTAAPSKAQFMAALGLHPNVVARSGRAARLTVEEAKFQAELAEAMRLSEEGQCSSSAEIVPPATSTNSETVRAETEETKPTSELVTNKRKAEEAEDFKEVKTQSGEKEEKVAVVNTSEEEEDEPRKLLSSTKKRVMKKTIISSDEEEDGVGGGGVPDQKSKRKTPPRKKSKKKNVVLSEDESDEEEEEIENVKEPEPASTQKRTDPGKKSRAKPDVPAAPLKTRNTESSGQLAATPKLSSSLATVLGKLTSNPGTPVQPKIPSWTPPAKVGTPGALTGPVGSPVIGLRLGLSRRFKSKPLHASVKTNH